MIVSLVARVVCMRSMMGGYSRPVSEHVKKVWMLITQIHTGELELDDAFRRQIEAECSWIRGHSLREIRHAMMDLIHLKAPSDSILEKHYTIYVLNRYLFEIPDSYQGLYGLWEASEWASIPRSDRKVRNLYPWRIGPHGELLYSGRRLIGLFMWPRADKEFDFFCKNFKRRADPPSSK